MSEIDVSRRNGIPDVDLTGNIFGDLKVVEYAGKGKWLCQCSCGVTKIVRKWDLENRKNPTCGDRTRHIKVDLTNKRFGSWVVIARTENGKWLCECDCENHTRREISTYELTSGHTKSCGHSTGKVIDMTGKTLYELTFKEYLGNGYWRCKCSCGKTVDVLGREVRVGNTKSCGHIKGKSKIIDLTGQNIGEWEVLEYAGNSYWKCKCSCGEVKQVHSYTLRNNLSVNCGGAKHKIIDLTGKKFGDLSVIEYAGSGFWRCKCSCNNIKSILGASLMNGSTNSCGCKSDEFFRNTLINKYGEVCPSKVHNPRDIEQIRTLTDKELLRQFISDLTDRINRKPRAFEIAKLLGVHSHTFMAYLNKYELNNMIDVSENNNVSSYELTLLDIFPGAKVSDREVLNGLELDLYYPDKKIALEFNGNYWHSTAFKDIRYHQNKTIDCAKKGIRLIHIFEYEWNNEDRREKILNIIRSAMGISDCTIEYAKNTVIKEIDKDKDKEFLEKYHIQGYAEASIILGCICNNELIGVMSFGKPRFNNTYQYELIRLCWKPGIRVVGGLEKLFHYFLIKYTPKSIITYSDIAKFTGNSYLRLGFKPLAENPITAPNYIWLDRNSNEVLSRYQTQKHKLVELGLGDESQTGDEIMESLGYFKIYDSGNLRLEWKA